MNLLTIKQAAKELGLEATTLRQYAYLGKIKIVKIGYATMIEPGEVERFKRGRTATKRDDASS